MLILHLSWLCSRLTLRDHPICGRSKSISLPFINQLAVQAPAWLSIAGSSTTCSGRSRSCAPSSAVRGSAATLARSLARNQAPLADPQLSAYRKPTSLQIEEQLLPGLRALAHAVDQQAPSCPRACPDDDQQALRGIFGLHVDAVDYGTIQSCQYPLSNGSGPHARREDWRMLAERRHPTPGREPKLTPLVGCLARATSSIGGRMAGLLGRTQRYCGA
jgi:hypothetical protein